MIDSTPNRPSPTPAATAVVGQHAGHGEHADVDDEEGDHQVTAPVPWEVQGKDEQADRHPIGGENRNLRHGILQVNNW